MTAPLDLEHKSAPTVDAPAPTGPAEPDHEGIVETLVAVTGVKDDVGDVIVPGAFTRTLRERKAKVCLGHDWNRPIGKTLDIKELWPGDPRLPEKTATGDPWPKEAGAVWARYRANLETEDGKAAFLNAKFFGPQESTYSIGYKTVKARHKGGVRYIDDLDLFEYGPVLHPANRLATLQSIKSGEPDGIEVSDILASWESVKDAEPEGMTFQDYSASLLAVDVELKARRYVQDASYWGYPKGTLIVPGMKPRGTKARKLRQRGVVPSRNVGVADKPDSRARRGNAADVAVRMGDEGLDLGTPDGGLTSDARVRARNPKGKDEQHVAALLDTLVPGTRETDEEREVRERKRDVAFERLLDEGITPNELREDLDEHDDRPDDLDDDAIDDAVDRYTKRYREVAAEQAAERRAAKPADEPAKPKAPAKPAAPKARTAEQIRADLDKAGSDKADRAKWEIDNGAPVVDGPPGSGLFAYGPKKGYSGSKDWTVTTASGLGLPNAVITKYQSADGRADLIKFYPTSAKRATAFLNAIAALRDADGKPFPAYEADPDKANAAVRTWRDADGRGFAQALADVAVPAYLRAIGQDDAAATVERRAGIERPADDGPADEPVTPDPEEFARRITAVAEELGLRVEAQAVQTSNAGLVRSLRVSDPESPAGNFGTRGAILTWGVDGGPREGSAQSGHGGIHIPPERVEDFLRAWVRLREKYDEPRGDMVMDEMNRPAREAAARDERDAQERRLVADADDAALIGQYEQYRDMAQSLTDRGIEREGNAAWEMIDRRMALVEAEMDRRGLERPAPPAAPGTEGRATALSRIEATIARLDAVESRNPGPATTAAMLRQFTADPDDVRASGDGRLASLWNGRTWVTVDTGTGQSLPVPDDVDERNIPDILEELAALDVPWGDGDAMRARWEDPNRKWADQVDVIDILSQYTDTKLKKPAKPRKTAKRETVNERRAREDRERADRANREEEARRGRGRPPGVSDAVAAFGEGYVEPDITPPANVAVSPAEYDKARRRAEARKYRADEIERDRKEYRETLAAIADSERMAADAPDTIPSDQVPDNGVPVAGGRLVLTDANKVGWALRTASGAVVASAYMLDSSRRVKPKRAQLNELADRIAAITDGAGNRIPTTLGDNGWAKGFRDPEGRGAQAALSRALLQWADANGFPVTDSQRWSAERPPRPPREPGVPDSEGFHPDERALHLSAGDRVRMDDGTIRTVRAISTTKDTNNTTDKVFVYWEGLDDDQRTRYDLLSRVDVQHPYDPEDVRDPGMGYQNTDMGQRVGEIRSQAEAVREKIDKGDFVAPGTRFVDIEQDGVFRKADTRPRVGTVTDRWVWVGAVGNWFQVVRYDDGTYDAFNAASMVKEGRLELNPSPERVLEARRAWGLEPDVDAPVYTQGTDPDGFTSLPDTGWNGGDTDTPGVLPSGKRPSPKLIEALGRAERRRVTGTAATRDPNTRPALTDADVLAVTGHENTIFALFKEGLANRISTGGRAPGVLVLNERGRRLMAPYLPATGDDDTTAPDPGTPDPGTPDPGTPDPGTPDEPTVTDVATTDALMRMSRAEGTAAVARMGVRELERHDAEMARRAEAVGQAGRVTAAHQAVRDALERLRSDPGGTVPPGSLYAPEEFDDARLDAEIAAARARLDAARAEGFRPGNGVYDDAKLAVDVLTTEKNRRAPAAPVDGVRVAGVDWVARPTTGLRDTDERWTGRLPDGRTGTVTRSGDQWSWTILGTGAADDSSGFDTYASRDDAMRAMLNPQDADPDRGIRIGREPRRNLRYPAAVDTDRIDPDDVGDARDLGDEALGLTEDEDGELVVTPEVAERQDRVERLIRAADAGSLDLTTRTDDELIGTRKDVVAELRLQEAVRRRDAASGRPDGGGVTRRGGGVTTDDGDADDGGTTAPPQPRRRPGLAGAAEDYTEALEGGNAADIERTRARLLSSLNRSRTDSAHARDLRAHLEADAADDPAAIRTLAEALRTEARERRNATARDRRRVKRLERERLRSLLGQVDAELRNRNVVLPDDGRADGETGDATGDGSTAATRMIGGLAFTAEDVGPGQGEMLTATLPDGRTGGVRDTGAGWAWFIRGAGGLDDRGDGHAEPGAAVAEMLERAPATVDAGRGLPAPGPEPERVPEEDPDLPPEDYNPPPPPVSTTLGDLGALNLDRLSLLVETLDRALPQTGVPEVDAARMAEARRMIFEEYGRRGATRVGDLPDGTWFTLGLDNWDQDFLFHKRAEGDYVDQDGKPWHPDGDLLDYPAMPKDAPPPPTAREYPPGRDGARERLADLKAGPPLPSARRIALAQVAAAPDRATRVSESGALIATTYSLNGGWRVFELSTGEELTGTIGQGVLDGKRDWAVDDLLADLEMLDIPWADRDAMRARWSDNSRRLADLHAVGTAASPAAPVVDGVRFEQEYSAGRVTFIASLDAVSRLAVARTGRSKWTWTADFRRTNTEEFDTAEEAARAALARNTELTRKADPSRIADIGRAFDEARAAHVLFSKSMPKSTTKGYDKIRELRRESNRLENAMLEARELYRRTQDKLPAGQREEFDPSRYKVPVWGGTEKERKDVTAMFRNVIMDGLTGRQARVLTAVEIIKPGNLVTENALADYSLHNHVMRIGKHGLDYSQADYNQSIKSKWWVNGQKFGKPVEQIVTHEMGHHMDSLLTRSQRQALFTELAEELARLQPGVLPYRPSPTGGSAWNDGGAKGWVEQNRAAIIAHVSTYASHSEFELIAELWTEFRGKNEPSTLARIAGKHLLGVVDGNPST